MKSWGMRCEIIAHYLRKKLLVITIKLFKKIQIISSSITRLWRLTQKDPKLYLGLGNALIKQGQRDGAIVFYQMGLQLKPNDAELSLQLGKLLEGKTPQGTSPKQIVQPDTILKKVEVLDTQTNSNKGMKNSSFEGCLDTVTTYYVSGWARD